MTYETQTVTFDTVSEAIYMYDLRFISNNGGKVFAGYRWADNGRKIQIFARQHLGDAATFTISEDTKTVRL